MDEGGTVGIDARDMGLGVWVMDVPDSARLAPGAAVDFTMWWPEAGCWEGANWRVTVEPPAPDAAT